MQRLQHGGGGVLQNTVPHPTNHLPGTRRANGRYLMDPLIMQQFLHTPPGEGPRTGSHHSVADPRLP